MTEEQRELLAKKIVTLLRREWGPEFTDEDEVRIYDFCMDEAETNDVLNEAVRFELKYG